MKSEEQKKKELLSLIHAAQKRPGLEDMYVISFSIQKMISQYEVEYMTFDNLQRMIHSYLGDMIYDIMKMQRQVIDGEEPKI